MNTRHQAHSARLTDACRTVGKTPHSTLTLPGHTQGQHYTGYTRDEGDGEGRERRGEKERESARALVLEKGKKKEPYLKDGSSCCEAVFPGLAGSWAHGIRAELAPGPPCGAPLPPHLTLPPLTLSFRAPHQ